jgi:hypothetical protein
MPSLPRSADTPPQPETPLQTWTRSFLELVADAQGALDVRAFHAFAETGFFRFARELVDAELDDWRRAA